MMYKLYEGGNPTELKATNLDDARVEAMLLHPDKSKLALIQEKDESTPHQFTLYPVYPKCH